MTQTSSRTATSLFYLFASSIGESSQLSQTVVCKVKGETDAKDLGNALYKKYGPEDELTPFWYHKAAALSAENRVALDKTLKEISSNSSAMPFTRWSVQEKYAMFAQAWKLRLQKPWRAKPDRKQDSTGAGSIKPATAQQAPAAQTKEGQPNQLPLQQLWLFTETYYKILRIVIEESCKGVVDRKLNTIHLELNDSYSWVIEKLKHLLNDNTCLPDFRMPFEPAVSDLAPSTIYMTDWKDILPKVTAFCDATVDYLCAKGIRELQPGTTEVQIFSRDEKECGRAIKRAKAYETLMDKQSRKFRDVLLTKDATKGATAKGAAQVKEKRETTVTPICVNEVYDLDLNENSTHIYCSCFFKESSPPQGASPVCAGRVRLALHGHAFVFTVLGKNELKPGRIVRIVTEGNAKLVEFEDGVVRDIDFVDFPSHDEFEIRAVRSAALSKKMNENPMFSRLPTATLENGWRLIRLPSKKVLDLGGRKLKRSIILEEIWKHCVKNRTLEFKFGPIMEDYNKRVGSGTQINSSRLLDDSFRGQKPEFLEMFECVGAPTNEAYKLKVRFAKPG